MHKSFRQIAMAFALALMSASVFGALVDTDNNPVTNATLLGNIDMGNGTVGELQDYMVTNVSKSATNYADKIYQDSTNYVNSKVKGYLPLSGGYLDGVLGFIYSGNTGMVVKAKSAGALQFSSRQIPGKTATLDISRIGSGDDDIAYQSDVSASAASVSNHVTAAVGAAAQASTNYTDTSISQFASTNSVMAGAPYLQESMVTNTVKDIVTNSVVVGYTEWTYSGDTSPSAVYSITSASSGSGYIFTLWDTTIGQSLGTAASSEINPIILAFVVTGGTITATRSEIRRNSNGLAMYSDVVALETKIEDMDTSYYRFSGITNKNQSVQYVYLDSTKTTLTIEMPESGMTKDWLVYVLSEADVTLVLPPATYWTSSETVTNNIPSLTPTAFYFSQITDDTYSLSRKEMTVPITIENDATRMNRKILEKRKARRTFR